jgi:hypothetical protein
MQLLILDFGIEITKCKSQDPKKKHQISNRKNQIKNHGSLRELGFEIWILEFNQIRNLQITFLPEKINQ